MDTGEEIKGQARKDGKLGCACGNAACGCAGESAECGCQSQTERSDAPAIPYGNPPEASQEPNPEQSPGISSFA